VAVQTFTLTISRQPTGEEFDALYANGCDDAIFGQEDGVSIAEFDREAPTLADAIASAVIEVERAGLAAVRVLDTDLVTLDDIGTRIKQSRESVGRYATGERGPGGGSTSGQPGSRGYRFLSMERGCAMGTGPAKGRGSRCRPDSCCGQPDPSGAAT
jgi:hypothetical protein